MSSPFLRCTPILSVTDLDRSLPFYERLGFAVRRYQGDEAYAFLTRGGLELHLSQADASAAEQTSGRGVYFYLEDGSAVALQAEFVAAGVPIHSPLALRAWKMLEFVVVDPDKNLLRFGEFAPANA